MNTEIIWTNFSDALKRFIYSRVHDHSVAEDLLQNVFIKIHLNVHTIQKKESLKSWVFTLTNNVIIDYYKTHSPKITLDAVLQQSEPEKEMGHSAADCLRPLIHNLPPIYSEALKLSELQGLKHAEVAKKLNISLSGAKSRIQRGRDLLKKGFIDCCNYKLNKHGYLVGEHKDQKDCKICTTPVSLSS